jgi:hypothetical protein
LHDCLKRLALVEPTFYEDEIETFSAKTIDEIFTTRENSYSFFVSTLKENKLPDAINRQAKILRY